MSAVELDANRTGVLHQGPMVRGGCAARAGVKRPLPLTYIAADTVLEVNRPGSCEASLLTRPAQRCNEGLRLAAR